MAADYGWVTRAATVPLASALKAAKAAPVDPGEFRTLDENAHLMMPLVGRGFQARELKDRVARNGNLSRDWRLGVRLGPNGSGIYSRVVSDLDATPPGIRKAALR